MARGWCSNCTPAVGVAKAKVDAGPLPTSFVATTVQRCRMPLRNPRTVTGLALLLPVCVTPPARASGGVARDHCIAIRYGWLERDRDAGVARSRDRIERRSRPSGEAGIAVAVEAIAGDAHGHALREPALRDHPVANVRARRQAMVRRAA